MTTATTVLVMIDRLRFLFRTALPEDVAVSIGPPPGGDVPAEYAAVAYGGDDRPDAISTPSIPEWGNRTEQHQEDITVWCTVSVAGGDQNAFVLLSIVSDYLQAIGIELKKDPTLGDVIDAGGYANLGAHEWLIDNGGDVVTVFFQVNIHLPWVD